MAFADAAERRDVIDPLIARLLGAVPLAEQPDPADVADHLDRVIVETMDCQDTGGQAIDGCQLDAARTRSVVKAACAAGFGNAALLLQ